MKKFQKVFTLVLLAVSCCFLLLACDDKEEEEIPIANNTTGAPFVDSVEPFYDGDKFIGSECTLLSVSSQYVTFRNEDGSIFINLTRPSSVSEEKIVCRNTLTGDVYTLRLDWAAKDRIREIKIYKNQEETEFCTLENLERKYNVIGEFVSSNSTQASFNCLGVGSIVEVKNDEGETIVCGNADYITSYGIGFTEDNGLCGKEGYIQITWDDPDNMNLFIAWREYNMLGGEKEYEPSDSTSVSKLQRENILLK